MDDISVDIGKIRVNVRVAGILERKGTVLVMKMKGSDFWFLPGGRVAVGETFQAALARELKEELAIDFEIGTFGFICENFFTFDNKAYHELCAFFQVPCDSGLCSLPEDDGALFRWMTPAELKNSDIRPSFLAGMLFDRPYRQSHIICRNET